MAILLKLQLYELLFFTGKFWVFVFLSEKKRNLFYKADFRNWFGDILKCFLKA